jgi:hypothetical protein
VRRCLSQSGGCGKGGWCEARANQEKVRPLPLRGTGPYK